MCRIPRAKLSDPDRVCTLSRRPGLVGAFVTLASVVMLTQPSVAQNTSEPIPLPSLTQSQVNALAQGAGQVRMDEQLGAKAQEPLAINSQTGASPAQAEDGNPNRSAPGQSQETSSEQSVSTFLEEPATTLRQMLTPSATHSDLPHDLSVWGMFSGADAVVKSVMLSLALASFVTWTIWLAKLIELAYARASVNRTLKVIRESRTLEQATAATPERGDVAALMLRAATEELQFSDHAIAHAGGAGLKERVAAALERLEAFFGRRMSRGTGVLATIGATAPFVGLFGTVWGIMNAFIGISQSHTTNLAVVAPGIAEALLTTAAGLVAAIPAVIIYNVFARSVTGYRQLLGDAATGVEGLLSRDLDFRMVPSGARTLTAPSLAAE